MAWRTRALPSDLVRTRSTASLIFAGKWDAVERVPTRFLLSSLLLSTLNFFYASAAEPTRSQLDFFENKVRPIFAEHCYKCHSPEKGKVKGGLELDWRDGLLKGGDSGPAIVPGDPEKSLLIKAVRYQDENPQMPPKGEKLSDAQITDLVSWIKMGAPDPRATRPVVTYASRSAGGKSHWAYQPVRKPAIPEVKTGEWVATPIDAFILAKLEGQGMKPSAPAGKRTLIRRATFDLIGLPPTPEEVQAFLNDSSPKAFEKVVDRLLESPHYGERWGRHWLDTARYSDTKGQFDRRRESTLYPYAWTYRDYVIRSFNEDKPYDRFIIEQIAGDRLTSGGDKSALAALGFLTLGDHFQGNQNDIINDRIDVVSKGLLGLTVSCARCHDHMFDPIPTRDYYALHGIFASSIEPPEKPLLAAPKSSPDYQEYLQKRADLETRIQTAMTQNIAAVFGDYRKYAGVFLAATELSVKQRTAYLAQYSLDTDLVKNWEALLKLSRRRDSTILGPWHFFSNLPEKTFAEQARRMLANLPKSDRAKQIHPQVLQAFQGAAPKSMNEVAAIYGGLFAKNDPQWQASLTTLLAEVAQRLLPNKQRRAEFVLREEKDLLEMTHPGSPARGMVLQDSSSPRDSRIFLRGEAENPGEVAPRQFLEILSQGKPAPFKQGSGRLELARAIASKNNPLTARVMVNRIWLHHFGEGFVTTPDDFGTQSAPPSHPELLDYLADRFMEEGWSMKKMHRLIMLSSVYQQSSQNNPRYAEIDPYNRLLWRANIRRLEFEPLRDSILALGGKLDRTLGGKPVDLTEGQGRSQKRYAVVFNRKDAPKLSYATRRTVYGYIDRSDMPEVLNHFDFASPDMTMGKRYETTVPQQALFLMNSPLVIEQARNMVARPDFLEQSTSEGRIKLLYELIYQRPPQPDEIKLGLQFLDQFPGAEKAANASPQLRPAVVGQVKRRNQRELSRPAPARAPLSGWAEYAHALLLGNETSFVN